MGSFFGLRILSSVIKWIASEWLCGIWGFKLSKCYIMEYIVQIIFHCKSPSKYL